METMRIDEAVEVEAEAADVQGFLMYNPCFHGIPSKLYLEILLRGRLVVKAAPVLGPVAGPRG